MDTAVLAISLAWQHFSYKGCVLPFCLPRDIKDFYTLKSFSFLFIYLLSIFYQFFFFLS